MLTRTNGGGHCAQCVEIRRLGASNVAARRSIPRLRGTVTRTVSSNEVNRGREVDSIRLRIEDRRPRPFLLSNERIEEFRRVARPSRHPTAVSAEIWACVILRTRSRPAVEGGNGVQCRFSPRPGYGIEVSTGKRSIREAQGERSSEAQSGGGDGLRVADRGRRTGRDVRSRAGAVAPAMQPRLSRGVARPAASPEYEDRAPFSIRARIAGGRRTAQTGGPVTGAGHWATSAARL